MGSCQQLVEEKIRTCGPLTFARFMEIALYDPGCGYYGSGRPRVGKRGDFITAVSLGPAYGRVLAKVFQEIWELLEQPSEFCLIEQGAGDGQLLADVLDSLSSPFLDTVQAILVEPLSALRDSQRVHLKGRRVHWVDSPEEVGNFRGVQFSNELVDALPFHLLVARDGGWRELYVSLEPSGLEFVEGPASEVALEESRILERLPEGWIVEVRPAAGHWLRGWSRRLEHGAVLIFDYGDEGIKLRSPSQPRGTFRCYENHRMDDRPLERPGCKDITASVDFTALGLVGQSEGLEVLGPVEFGRFLTRSAAGLLNSMDGRPDIKFLRNFQMLVRPETFGAAFRAFGLAAGDLRGRCLSGFHTALP